MSEPIDEKVPGPKGDTPTEEPAKESKESPVKESIVKESPAKESPTKETPDGEPEKKKREYKDFGHDQDKPTRQFFTNVSSSAISPLEQPSS
jgi:hypothetical protein